jgi:hypothetical protein
MGEKAYALWNSHLLSQIVDSMADGVFTLDVKGMKHHYVRYC